eukprot:TRINITY_DN10890_c0_g1_i1.p1 TRINITY_DN10890_c0_g1~~TRINITY_DN10890_c0_g1_i1.p1  ORF type:complete len:353 (+),score=79.18 TRINITY_DN10890_c0_g1_i1:86-1144(+)
MAASHPFSGGPPAAMQPNPFGGRGRGGANPFAKPGAGAAASDAAGANPFQKEFRKPVYKPAAASAGERKVDSSPSDLLRELGDGGPEVVRALGGEEACFQRVAYWLPTRFNELAPDERRAAVSAAIIVLSSLGSEDAGNDGTQRRVSRIYFGLQQTKDALPAHILQQADAAFAQCQSRGFSMMGAPFDRLGAKSDVGEVIAADKLSWDDPPPSIVAAADAVRKRSSRKVDPKWFKRCFDSDDGMHTDKETLPLRCPFMMRRMRDPVRSTHCKPHLGCTDLIACLVVSRQQGRSPTCPYCDAKLAEADLVVDPLAAMILKVAPANCTAVSVEATGQWKAIDFDTGDDDDSGSD